MTDKRHDGKRAFRVAKTRARGAAEAPPDADRKKEKSARKSHTSEGAVCVYTSVTINSGNGFRDESIMLLQKINLAPTTNRQLTDNDPRPRCTSKQEE